MNSAPAGHPTTSKRRAPRSNESVAGSRPFRDWRTGGRSSRGWDMTVVAAALFSVGVGVIASALIARVPAPAAGIFSLIALWVCLGVSITFAFVRGRPRGLFTFRVADLTWAVSVGLLLRLIAGLTEGANRSPFPSLGSSGDIPSKWWIETAMPALIGAPVIEELFFRAVVLIGIYNLLRRSVGTIPAGVTAVLGSALSFTALHLLSGPVAGTTVLQLFLVGLACASTVVLTGRLWAAVGIHFVYNASYLVLVLTGSLLG